MKSKIAMFNLNSKSTFSATLSALILGLIVLWTGSAAVAAEKKYVTDPSTGKVVTAPEYGGTLRLGWNREPEGTDPSIAGLGGVHHQWRCTEASRRGLGNR